MYNRVIDFISCIIVFLILLFGEGIPDLLCWLSYYFGEFGSWIIFIFVLLFIILILLDLRSR